MGLNVSAFGSAGELSNYRALQGRALAPPGGTVSPQPNVWPWAYGYSPLGGNRWQLAAYGELPPFSELLEKNKHPSGMLLYAAGVVAAEGAYSCWAGATKLLYTWPVVAFWYPVLFLREKLGSYLASEFPIMNLLLVAALFALFRVHMGVTMDTAATDTATADAPASARLLDAQQAYDDKLHAASEKWRDLLTAATKSVPNDDTSKNVVGFDWSSTTPAPTVASLKAHLAGRAEGEAAIALDWLSHLQRTLQLSDDETEGAVGTALFGYMKLTAGEAKAPTTPANRDAVAQMMGYMAYDPTWMATLRVAAHAPLHNALTALRDHADLESALSSYFRGRAVWSVAILATVAYLLALRWRDDAMYALLVLALVALAGAGAAYVVTHVVRVV